MRRVLCCLLAVLWCYAEALAERPPAGTGMRVDEFFDESGKRIDAATVMERIASGRYTMRTELGPNGASRLIVIEVTNSPEPRAGTRQWTPGAPAGSRLSKGDLWPYPSARTLANEKIAIVAGAHRAVIIDFWFTHCAPCVAAMPQLNELQQRFADRGVLLLAPSFEDTDTLRAFLQRRDFRWPVVPLADEWFRTLFGGHSAPHYVLLDRDLRVRLITKKVDMLESALVTLLRED